MAVGELFGPRHGRTLGSPPWEADITRGRNTRNKVIRGIKDKFNKKPRAAFTDAKNEKGVEVSVARENPARSAQSKFQREEPEGNGEG